MIAIGSDHGGYDLKCVLVDFLKENNYLFTDFGTNNPDSVDYPDYAYEVSKAVVSGKYEKGILICGTGIGISIAANKVKGIRAALCTNSFMAKLSRQHNDANVLVLGGRIVASNHAIDILETWLNTDFEGGRHLNRVNKITQIEDK